MTMIFTYLLPLPLVTFILLRLYRLIKNYRAALAFGLPIITLPVSFEDAWWIPLKPLFSWIETALPFDLGRWHRYTDIGWPMIDGLDTVSRLESESFVLVSPNRNQICTAYPPAAEQIYRDSKTWIRPAPFADTFATFGRSLLTEDGADWVRHRKITAPAFSEQTMRAVWEESTSRTLKDLKLAEHVEGGTRYDLERLRTDCMIMAMHVLVIVGFGQDIASVTRVAPGHKLTLMQSLDVILRNVVATILFSGVQVPEIFLPSSLRMLKLSVAEYKRYTEETVFQQMQEFNKKSSKINPKPSILEAMVKANEAEKNETTTTLTSKLSFLTESELYGNLFAFNVAGYETTGGSLTFALPYLALYPDLQQWLREEIDRHYNPDGNNSYNETYPKLIRCLAFMYETLRLAGPAAQMIRSPTKETTTTLLPISPGRSIRVDSNTLVAPHFYALHTSPRWGSDGSVFNPRRFIRLDENGEEAFTATPAQSEGATFVAWLMGPHVCPGKKFSTVEFVAIIARLLSLYRVEVDRRPVARSNGDEKEESEEEARKRLLRVLGDKYFNIGVHLKRPRDAGVRFMRRSG